MDDTRRELEEAIREAIGISDDHFLKLGESKKPVSYTHLDVYKRQAYAWIGPQSGTGESGGSSYRFDLCGLQAGQTGYSKSGIKTSFNWQGYATYIQVENNSKYKANGSTNGAVEDLSLSLIHISHPAEVPVAAAEVPPRAGIARHRIPTDLVLPLNRKQFP